MKVLMTGITSNQNNVRRKKNPLYSGASGIAYALEMAGHEVDNFAFSPSTRVSDYDAVLVGLYSPNSIVSGGVLGALTALFRAVENCVPVALFVDDWHLSGLLESIRNLNMISDSRLNFIARGKQDEWRQQEWSWATQYLMDKDIPLFVPWFPWCDTTSIMGVLCKRENVVFHDPSNVFPKVPVRAREPHEKSRTWILSSRYDFTRYAKSLGATWNVRPFGCKKCNSEIVPNELDLLEAAYAPSWGVLSHPYPPKLRGQWRNRYLFAMWCGSIIYANNEESATLGYEFNVPIRFIESLRAGQLDTLADTQRDVLEQATWSAEVEVATIAQNLFRRV